MVQKPQLTQEQQERKTKQSLIIERIIEFISQHLYSESVSDTSYRHQKWQQQNKYHHNIMEQIVTAQPQALDLVLHEWLAVSSLPLPRVAVTEMAVDPNRLNVNNDSIAEDAPTTVLAFPRSRRGKGRKKRRGFNRNSVRTETFVKVVVAGSGAILIRAFPFRPNTKVDSLTEAIRQVLMSKSGSGITPETTTDNGDSRTETARWSEKKAEGTNSTDANDCDVTPGTDDDIAMTATAPTPAETQKPETTPNFFLYKFGKRRNESVPISGVTFAEARIRDGMTLTVVILSREQQEATSLRTFQNCHHMTRSLY